MCVLCLKAEVDVDVSRLFHTIVPMTPVLKSLLSTITGWLVPIVVAIHFMVHAYIMQIAPNQLCTYHNGYERVCGKGQWSSAMEAMLLVEITMAIAGLASAIFLLKHRKLPLAGKIGLLLSGTLALIFCGFVANAIEA